MLPSGIRVMVVAVGFALATRNPHPEIARRVRKLGRYRTKRALRKAIRRLARFSEQEATRALSAWATKR